MSIGTIKGTTDADGIVKISDGSGLAPIAAVPYSILGSAIIIHTSEFYAKIFAWNDFSTGLANTPVTLLVFYVTT